MVSFHNTVGSAALTKWVAPNSQQIAFARGTLGFVVVNNADSAWTNTFTTGLAAGTYCDVASVATATQGTKCSGATWVNPPNIARIKTDSCLWHMYRLIVSSTGTMAATVPARSSIAIHTGAKCTDASCPEGVVVNFAATVSTVDGKIVVFGAYYTITDNFLGEYVYVLGNISEFGNWQLAAAVSRVHLTPLHSLTHILQPGLNADSYPVWEASVTVPSNTPFEYKYAKKESDGSLVWEAGANRVAKSVRCACDVS